MVSTVHSLTHRSTWRPESYIWCRRMQTTTSFTLRLSGAHLTKNTIRPSVIMRITGKISEENPISLTTMHMSSVRTGKPVLLSESMKKAVSYRQLAWDPMVGKSKSTTPSTIRQDLALRSSADKSINARSITLNKTGEWSLLITSSKWCTLSWEFKMNNKLPLTLRTWLSIMLIILKSFWLIADYKTSLMKTCKFSCNKITSPQSFYCT